MGCVLTYMVFIRKGGSEGHSLRELCPLLQEGCGELTNRVMCPHLHTVHKEGCGEGYSLTQSCVLTYRLFIKKGMMKGTS